MMSLRRDIWVEGNWENFGCVHTIIIKMWCRDEDSEEEEEEE